MLSHLVGIGWGWIFFFILFFCAFLGNQNPEAAAAEPFVARGADGQTQPLEYSTYLQPSSVDTIPVLEMMWSHEGDSNKLHIDSCSVDAVKTMEQDGTFASVLAKLSVSPRNC